MCPPVRCLLPGISVAAALLSAPSAQATDCNGNGEDDIAEIAAGRASDCNLNGVPDPCDVVASRSGLGVRTRFGLEAAASSMAVGDLDVNGRPDVITAAQGTESGLVIYFQDPGGSFEPQDPLRTGSDVIADMETADLDGDGDLDLVAASMASTSGQVAVLRNDGTGGFGEPEHIVAERPQDLIARDLDGDGRTDLAFASLAGRRVVVLWNDGSAGFSALVIPDGSKPVSLAAADFQGDGKVDLLIGHEAPVLSAQRNLGDRAFQPDFRKKVPGSAMRVLAADLTGDGAPEAIALNGPVHVHRNNGQGDFETLVPQAAGLDPRALDTIDMDADGHLDVAVMNSEAGCERPFHSLQVLRNLGDGNLALPEAFQGGAVSTLAFPTIRTADMDGDGMEDVVTTSGTSATIPGYVTLLSPSFQAASADCDANGIPDECDPDCNWNGAPDACDLASLSSDDADLDDVPDECQADCNRNGKPDVLDVSRGESPDLDGSGFPDECESVAPADCNQNGLPDAAEIANGTAPDCNGNARPDACDLELEFVFDLMRGFHAPVREGGFVAAADLDGDGVIDFAVASRGACCPSTPRSGGITLFRGLGDGQFASLGEESLAGEPSALEAADIDGDGDPDLVASSVSTCRFTDSIAVLRNRGKATFGDPEVFPARGRPSVMILADMEGNGSADIFAVTATFDGKFARIFRNDGRGIFSEGPGAIAVGIDTWHAVPIDVNGDSLLDVVSARRDAGLVEVFFAGGGLQFGEPRSIEAARPGHIATGDLDGDADPDLVAIVDAEDTFARTGLTVLWNDRSGDFPAKTNLDPGLHGSWAAVRDLDRDGHEDIVLLGIHQGFPGGHFASLLGTIPGLGSAGFAAPSRFQVNGFIERPLASDLDGNGSVDVLATIQDPSGNHVVVFENTSSGAFRTGRLDLEGFPGPIAAADLDADGKVDLAVTVTNEEPNLGVFWNADHGAFSGLEEHVLPAEMEAMDPGDLDGDGDVDIAAVVPFEVRLFLNSGRRPLEVGVQKLVLGSITVGIAARDLDGDGDTDLVTANTSFQEFEDNVSVFENLGGNRFAAARNFVAGRRPGKMAAGDFDGDGDVDLAIRNLDPPNLGFLANNGFAAFSRRVTMPIHDPAFFLVSVDADADGDTDLAVGPAFGFLLNRGGWDLEWGGDPVQGNANAMAAADLDGDGAPEIIGGTNAGFTIHPNLGGGRVGLPHELWSPEGGGGPETMRGIAVADLDGDGRIDLAGSVLSERSFVRVIINRTVRYSVDAGGDGFPDECGSEPFRRGDSNGDGLVDLSDAIFILRSLFLGGEPLACLKAADANDDSRVDASDPVEILGALFLGDPSLPAPSAGCGEDPTGDTLGCGDFGGCA